ncbi:MAG: diaminopimelate decarboxylase [Halobacteriovoraceae bacterium]|nr:diaminopimelate decarboxylase [Halobacteriovoraceae bacterium]|tara:strand:- start:107812 stop:109014 length:1203 start_codon:yes stop_codon:yes gene_type:complete
MVKAETKKHIETVIDRFDASFYFYDLDLLRSHLSAMAEILDPDIKLWYACKANPMSAVLKVLRNLGFGIDVASSGELHQVLNSGIKGEHVIATGPGKSRDYLEHLIKNEVKTIVVESYNQVVWLDEAAQKLGKKVDALIRVQLDWNEGKSVLGGDAITPFGLGPEDWKQHDLQQFKNINFKGFHIFQWGNIMDPKKLESIWEKCVENILSLAADLNVSAEIMDLGGGLGVPYKEGQTKIDFKEIHEILVNLKKKYNLKTIWMELGRFTTAECGNYLTKIVDVKEVRGKKLLVTEGGINHCARVALTGQAFPCKALSPSNVKKVNFQVHGPLCTALDHLGDFDLPEDLKIGDWLIFTMAGAYGFTESMPYFLCHKLPGEALVYNNDLMVPRPPKTSYDWMI